MDDTKARVAGNICILDTQPPELISFTLMTPIKGNLSRLMNSSDSETARLENELLKDDTLKEFGWLLGSLEVSTLSFYAPLINSKIIDKIGQPGSILSQIRRFSWIGDRRRPRLMPLLEGALRNRRLTKISTILKAPILRHRFKGKPDQLWLIPINTSGKLALTIKNSTDLNSRLRDNKIPGAAVVRKAFHEAILPETCLYLIIISRAPRNSLFQIGLLSTRNWLQEIKVDLRDKLQGLANKSHFAALNLLLERERFFMMAVRQADGGKILKADSLPRIIDQKETLRKLAHRKRYEVPQIVRNKDSRPIDPWFTMECYKLPKLREVLATTAGLKQEDVEGIARAAIGHLRNTYWSKIQIIPKRSLKWNLIADIIYALYSAMDCTEKLKIRNHAILAGAPADVAGRLVFGPKTSEVDQGFHRALNLAESSGGFSVQWMWERNEPLLEIRGNLRGLSPVRHLRDCLTIIKKIPEKMPTISLKAKVIHGDSHLGNLLIDASVPEYPLLVSIDPAVALENQLTDILEKLTKSDDTNGSKGPVWRSVARHSSFKQPWMSLSLDPCFDLGKLLFDTTTRFGLFEFHGLSASAVHRGNTECVTLKRAVEERFPLDMEEGMSGARLVRISSPAPDEAWTSQDWASSTFIEDFRSLIEDSITRQGLGNSDVTNHALGPAFRTLILTIRHVFSMALRVYPRHPEWSMGLYAIGSLLACRLSKYLERLVDPPFNPAKLENDLWKYLSHPFTART